ATLYSYSFTTRRSSDLPRVVVVHSTSRNAEQYRDYFEEFAEKTNSIVLAPLFPAGIVSPDELHSYKFIQYDDEKYDDVLFAMIQEIKERYNLVNDKFLLHGFSGGGQFVQRFFYMYPNHLLGVSIGAPGWITYIDETMPRYVGTKDFEDKFGYSIPIEQMKNVPVQMVIGGDDNETLEINDKNHSFWMEGFDKRGLTRLERLDALRINYEKHNIKVQYDIVPGIKHDGIRLLEPVKKFFYQVLKNNNYTS